MVLSLALLGVKLTWASSHFQRSGDCWQIQKMCGWTWRTRPLLPCFLQDKDRSDLHSSFRYLQTMKRMELRAYPECWRSPSSRCLRKRGRSGFRAQAWPGPQSECSTECGSPPGCQRIIRSSSTLHLHSAVIVYFVTVTDLFEADIRDVPQDTFHCVCPFPLTQGILLSPNNINVMRDVIRSVVPRLPLALALKPGVDVVGSAGISWELMGKYFTVLPHYLSWIQIHSNMKEGNIVTHVPGADKHCDHVWFRLFRVFVLHLLKQLAEPLPFLVRHNRTISDNKRI